MAIQMDRDQASTIPPCKRKRRRKRESDGYSMDASILCPFMRDENSWSVEIML